MHSPIRNQPAAALVAAVAALITALNLLCAQPLKPEVLVSFNGTNGANPEAALTQDSDGNFYGTTECGGRFGYSGGGIGYGTVFQVTTNGTLTTLVSFDGTNGAYPQAVLTLGGDGNFYGLAAGSAFRVTTNGVLTTLVTLGENPPGLTLGSDGNFYGTTQSGNGAVFRVTTNGVLATFVSFDGTTNGASPGGLTLDDDGNFYGTTTYGSHGLVFGTVFEVTTNGVLTTLYHGVNDDLYEPNDLTTGSDGNFYGTTYRGGIYGAGTVFRVTTNGVFTTLHSFGEDTDDWGNLLWAYPHARLAKGSDGNFYGTTSGFDGFSYHDGGTVFQITTNGVLTTLVRFGEGGVGYPWAGLTSGSDGSFYGTAASGGAFGKGVIYRLRREVTMQSFGMTTSGFQLNTLNVGGSGWVVLESSSDLTTWTPIQTNGTAAAQTFLDPTALTQPRQFYRVRQQ
jgi:uncharacterized repeat protein (TIGR03803 family)